MLSKDSKNQLFSISYTRDFRNGVRVEYSSLWKNRKTRPLPHYSYQKVNFYEVFSHLKKSKENKF